MNDTPSKTRYFLIELIVNCLFFALAAAICAGLFAKGFADSKYSEDLAMATLKAQNYAEIFKAAKGSEEMFSEIATANDYFEFYYDENWQECDAVDLRYLLKVDIGSEVGNIKTADISVAKLDKTEIYSLTVKRYVGDIMEVTS